MRISVIGNSGSGKTTYARQLSKEHGIPILDLDQVAWEPDAKTTLRDSEAAAEDVTSFCERHGDWIVEGCYANLILATLDYKPELVFLDPGEEQCVLNCQSRPWEPSKYSSKAEQDANLGFLLSWIREYYHREDDLSHKVHVALFDNYSGPKRRLDSLPALT